ncbi:protein lethal(2)essential for life-like [Babylonia areolata]|uniref:protein lethal(2)essential for life-like n=1 Tax=Babylonia areolata TaxID=304850 RepID=UPI003FD0CF30
MALRPRHIGIWSDPFGDIFSEDFFMPSPIFGCPNCSRQLCTSQQNGAQESSEVDNSNQEFQIKLDVCQFKPDEISVKTRDDRVIINAQHEEREDEHGFIKREFARQIVLPKDVDTSSVTSSLTRDGILILKAKKILLPSPAERIIPITQEDEGDEEEEK